MYHQEAATIKTHWSDMSKETGVILYMYEMTQKHVSTVIGPTKL